VLQRKNRNLNIKNLAEDGQLLNTKDLNKLGLNKLGLNKLVSYEEPRLELRNKLLLYQKTGQKHLKSFLQFLSVDVTV